MIVPFSDHNQSCREGYNFDEEDLGRELFASLNQSLTRIINNNKELMNHCDYNQIKELVETRDRANQIIAYYLIRKI